MRIIVPFLLVATTMSAPTFSGPSNGHAEPPPIFVGKTLFEEVPAARSGLDFVNELRPDDPGNHLYPFGYACGGVSIGDLDGDDRPDVFCVGGAGANALYVQRGAPGELRFERVADDQVGGGEAWGTGASLVDIEGDGDLDILVCNYDSPNQLFINRSTPDAISFTEEAAAHGLDLRDASIISTFADIDNDGDLDAYIGCNRYVPPNGLPMEAPGRFDAATGTMVMFPKYERFFRAWRKADGNFEADSYGRDDRLLLNTGPGDDGRPRFVDVTENAGIDGAGHCLAATWIDFDHDGLVDLHVSNDFEDPDRFYRNLGPGPDGGVRFEDVVGDVLPYTTWSSMGADVADLDGDGLLDLLVADMSATTHFKAKVNMGEMGGRQREVLENGWPRQAMRNMLYLDTGRGCYREAAFMADLASSDWTWAVKLADFDLDGRPDVFFTNGMSRNYTDSDRPFAGRQRYGRTQWDHFRNEPPLLERNVAMRNEGDLRFRDVGGPWGLDKLGMSYSAAYGDLDRDGDLDLVVANLDAPVSLYRNDAEGHWLGVRLRGSAGNSGGAGALVRVETESHGTLVRHASPWRGFASTDDEVLHFGLGEDEEVRSIEVVWPGGSRQVLGATAADQVVEIAESAATTVASKPDPEPRFVPAGPDIGPGFVHEERPFDDFRIQPLLPGRLSSFGPCMTWTDLDGDGLQDVFIGGARDAVGELWMAEGEGRFRRVPVPAFDAHATSEDTAALWFDADGDGDQDLFVASGSTEFFQPDRRLRNRLYVNEGAGDGSIAFRSVDPASIGGDALNSHVVSASDVDGDGDQDLFVGSRSVPGRYPETPRSQLLRNDSTADGIRFVDATGLLAPGLEEVGLVTGATFVDLDGDDREDLAISCEWGPIAVWRHDGERLVDATDVAGTAAATGWWYGLEAGDVDGDGDMDLIGLNAGLNTKYGRPDRDRPAVLYFGDMDDSGRPDLIEAKCKDDSMLPVRGRSCSSGAMPFIRKEFDSFRAFASADLAGIYGDDELEEATRFEATGLESGVWINRSTPGRPAFEFQAFPRIAQIAPCYGAAIADLDQDGIVDIVLAQNHDHREPETGLWRGGVGQWLRGLGGGAFEAVRPFESGVVVRGDATAVEAVDIDGDGRLDLVTARNGDRVQTLRNVNP